MPIIAPTHTRINEELTMRYLSTIFFVSIFYTVWAQPLPNRYLEEIFTGFTITEEVQFSTAVPQPNPGGGFYEWATGYPLNVDESDISYINLYMDIYQPQGDTLSKRPVIIIAFGGGFLSGSKDHWSMKLLAEDLAKRGFVTALIDYRLGMNVFDSEISKRAVYRGIQDGMSAVRFFRADADNANVYKIDPDHIYLGGHSSGGFIALHNAFLNESNDIIPPSAGSWTQDGNSIPDLGCLNCVGDNLGYDGRANNVFNLAGGLGELEFVDSGEDIRPVMFHSTDDSTVPYYSGGPFSTIIWLVVGSDLPDVYGSGSVAQEMDNQGLSYQFFSYTSREHEVHEDGTTALYTDIVPSISSWFVDTNIKGEQNITISGNNYACTDAITQNYQASSIEGGQYDWIASNATNMTTQGSEATVTWVNNGVSGTIQVVPYNCLHARLDTVSLQVEIQDPVDVAAIQSGQWHDPNNWSLNRVPRHCDDVYIHNTSITLSDLPAVIRTIQLTNTGSLLINSELKVSDPAGLP